MTADTLPRPPVLSMRRPRPWLIFHAGMDPESRSWTTTYRGDLLIHASNQWDGRAIPLAGQLHAAGVPGIALHRLAGDHDLHPPAVIVGVVELYDICTAARDRTGTCSCPPWKAPNLNHWRIRRPALFPRPVPSHGFRNLWQARDTIWPAIETQLKEIGRLA